MSTNCAASCDASCRSLGEANSTSTQPNTGAAEEKEANKEIKEDPVTAELYHAMSVAKQKFDIAQTWADHMKSSQKVGCPCPGRDFHPTDPNARTPGGKKPKDSSHKNSSEPELSAEEADALVEHYVKKYADASSWTQKHEEKLADAHKAVDVAEEHAKQKLHEAKGDFERMKTDKMFEEWFKDMCPCKGEDGYSEMMKSYFRVKGHAKAVDLNWHKAVLKEHEKQKAKAGLP